VGPYADGNSDDLRALKRGFETGTGEGTGDEDKRTVCEATLDADGENQRAFSERYGSGYWDGSVARDR